MRASGWILAVGSAAVLWAAAAPDEGPAFVDRVEARVGERLDALRARNLEHAALVAPVSERDLRLWIAPIEARPDGDAFVLAVGDTPEFHGGAVLDFLFRYWRPGDRAARPEDRFPFRGRDVALGEIYAGHRRQLFLPDADADATDLPRMRFFTANAEVPDVERDAYSFLRLLVEREPDLAATWENRFGQELSVDRLLRRVWAHDRTARDAASERDDHSNLHAVELLLAYHRRRGADSGVDPNAVKRRFLATELARPAAEVDDESAAHYAESLGRLAADPAVTFTPAEAAQVRGWLRELETVRFRDLATAEDIHLTHLLHGLRSLRAHERKWAIR